MARKRVTIRDVAARAGVSPTTVSFVLNDVPGLNLRDETRQRVLEAAETLGYVPSAAARSLVSGQTSTIGLVIFDAAQIQVDAFLPQMLYSLNHVSRERGFRVLMEPIEDIRRPDAYLDLVRSRQIDGLIVLNRRAKDKQLIQLIESGFPVVLIGSLDHPDACYVGMEDVRLSSQATAHLLNLGHKRIAYISYAPSPYLGARARLTGYRQALKQADIPYDEALVRFADHSAASGYLEMGPLLDLAPRPTALFAGNDTVAFGAMAAIHERGLRIPEDLAVVGYDDVPNARYVNPPLTTIRSKPLEIGRRAGEMLISLIQGEELEEAQVVIEGEFVIRDSCGARRATPTAPPAR
jgi:LacI family transcriptional regulator